MINIGILSDTHGFVHPRVLEFFKSVDEIWHAGDLGPGVMEQVMAIKPFRAVWGNIDDQLTRCQLKEYELFTVEEVRVLMIHIGGYPGRYTPAAKQLILREKPTLFISGHSHILKVIYDQQFSMLHINPGAAGRYGWHKSFTAIRMKVEGDQMKNLEVLDIPR